MHDARHGYRGAPSYRGAWWLPGAHLATLWGKLGRREPVAPARIERWDTPDGDFVEIVRLIDARAAASPRLVMLHGLEGGLHSHYVNGMFREASARGWGADLLLFRSCGAEPNRLPRGYHSGDTGDAAFVIERIAGEDPSAPIGVTGVSLGGNVLCKLLGERGDTLPNVRGAVATSVPFDLARASRHIGRGFGAVYEWSFLKSLVPKALAKIDRHRELAHLADNVERARTLWEFDDAFTAPVHGFDSAADYYARASSLHYLRDIRVPTLLLSAIDDPFLPKSVLDEVRVIASHNPAIELEFTPRGGHVGFTAGPWPWKPWYYGEWRAVDFLERCFARAVHDA